MSKIDQNVVDALKEANSTENGENSVRVIVVCERDCIQVAEAMKNQGIYVTQLIPELDMLVSDIKSEHLSFFESSEPVVAVELDQDVETQETTK